MSAEREQRNGTSARSTRLLKPALSYIGKFMQAFGEGLWDAQERPEGWIPLVVAENKLGNGLVLERLQAVSGFPPMVMNYSGMKGIPEFQAVMARLLERYLLPGHSVDPENVCISSGCSAVLDNLFYCLCDDGDGVLIPAPYYPAFDNDLQAKCCVHPLPFNLTDPNSSSGSGGDGSDGIGTSNGASIWQQLDAAVAEAAARGVPVRALLVTNPNNPLGTLYSNEMIAEMLRWCLDSKVHYVSDEIYALSIFKQQAASFTSAITLAQQLLSPAAPNTGNYTTAVTTSGDATAAATAAATDGVTTSSGAGDGSTSNGSSVAGYSQREIDAYVHLVYGLSKDWCASGLRVGLLYSRNQRLQQSLNAIAAFGGVSNHTQWALAQVLGDVEWADAFLQQNQKLLECSFDALAGALAEEGIPFLPAVGGMFVWVDLRHWLSEPSWDAELAFWLRVCDEAKIILTPGKDCHAAEPGFFRLCFAWMPAEALPEAIHRLKRVLASSGKLTV